MARCYSPGLAGLFFADLAAGGAVRRSDFFGLFRPMVRVDYLGHDIPAGDNRDTPWQHCQPDLRRARIASAGVADFVRHYCRIPIVQALRQECALRSCHFSFHLVRLPGGGEIDDIEPRKNTGQNRP